MHRFNILPIKNLFSMIVHSVVQRQSTVTAKKATTAAKTLAMWKLQQRRQSIQNRRS